MTQNHGYNGGHRQGQGSQGVQGGLVGHKGNVGHGGQRGQGPHGSQGGHGGPGGYTGDLGQGVHSGGSQGMSADIVPLPCTASCFLPGSATGFGPDFTKEFFQSTNLDKG